VNAFPIVVYDHHKCTTTIIKVHAKRDVLTCAPRPLKFTSQLWNCQRSYIMCICNQNAKSGCKGNMIWFDHSIWYMVNNLGMFFPDATYPLLPSKFGAFLTWMTNAARLAVKTHITFMAMRRLMEVAVWSMLLILHRNSWPNTMMPRVLGRSNVCSNRPQS
jgi:hypothetical protein